MVAFGTHHLLFVLLSMAAVSGHAAEEALGRERDHEDGQPPVDDLTTIESDWSDEEYEPEVVSPSQWSATFSGSYRVSFEGLSDMRVDADDNLYEQNGLITHRLRFAPGLHYGDTISLQADIQLATGFLYYDELNPRFATGFGPPRGADGQAFASADSYLQELQLRKLFLTWTTPIGQLRLGRQASDWGLGILANSGDRERQDWGSPRFGADRNYGDVVDRILFVTTPLALISEAEWAQRWMLAVGGDVVVRDDLAMRDQGDLALQAIGVVRYAHDRDEVGIYLAHRNHRDRNQDTLSVTAFDVFGQGTWAIDEVELYGAGEVAWVIGDTTFARNTTFTDISVQQLGWVARVGARYVPWQLGGDVEVGYASGDSNPNDEFLRNFTFDPDYNPSLILFDQLRAAETVAAAANASDPQRVGHPPSAIAYFPTGGGVTNAIYVRPTLRYAWESLGVRAAFMWAMAEEDILDPYGSTARGGGTAVNFQGGPGSARDLGIEVDAGIDYTYQLEDWFSIHGSLQGGVLLPGQAFANAAGNLPGPIGMVFGRLEITWLP